MTNNSIIAQNLSRKFGDFTAVDNISFEVKKGEVFGFLGPNGAGKTTTIRMLCGILDSTSGTGEVAGFNINTQSENVKASIGYMSQKFSLYMDLTVIENIEFYAGIYQTKLLKRKKRIDELLELADLAEKKDELTENLAAGYKQRLALCCAIVHEPPVVFLDEPTAGVDPISRRNFWNLIYTLSSQGTTVLVTTHYMDEAEHCDRLALIHKGKIAALDSPEVLKKTHMKGNVYEIDCTNSTEVLEKLRQSELFSDVALYGTKIHLVTGLPDAEIKINDYLKQCEFSINSISKIIPTLEDVFVSLVGGAT